MMDNKKLKFTAEIGKKDFGNAGYFRFVDVPFNINQEWNKGGQIWILGTINGAPFETTMMPYAEGGHYIMLNRDILKAGNAVGELGELLEMTVEENPNPRTVILPEDYSEVLDDYPHLKEGFYKLAIGKQAYLVKMITEVKSLDARANRIAKSLDLIAKWQKTK